MKVLRLASQPTDQYPYYFRLDVSDLDFAQRERLFARVRAHASDVVIVPSAIYFSKESDLTYALLAQE